LIGNEPPWGVALSIGVADWLGEPPAADGPWFRLAVMRAKRDVEDASVGSELVLAERERVFGLRFVGGGVPSAPGGAPEAGSSVWMKQQRLPYGQDPETQKV
jgi:hypothetical protein